MENYINKICPFCKTEITENDNTKVCPACDIPHHEGCWEENHGCTTFGCAEQHYEAQGTNPTAVCNNCGTALGDGQDFCPKCGTPKNAPSKSICGKCGAELQDGQEFCPRCGQKAGLAIESSVSSAISQFNADIDKSNEKKKKKPIKAIVAIIIVVALIIVGILVIPKLFVSVEDLCAQGNYQKAYEKAESNEKNDVIAENNIAVCSALAVNALKDSKSFDLRDAWYKPDSGYVVLKIAANNSYGNTVINYWLFTYDDDEDNEWEIWDAYSDLDEKEYNSYDDSDEFTEKFIYNLGITCIEKAMTSTYKIDKASVNRINTLFADDLLDSVDHIDAAIPPKE